MKPLLLPCCAIALLLFALGAWLLQAPTVDYTFPEGRFAATWRCTLSDDPTQTQHQAEAAHAFYKAQVKEIADTTAQEMQAAMARAKTSPAAIAEIKQAEDRGIDQGNALLATIETRFGCKLVPA